MAPGPRPRGTFVATSLSLLVSGIGGILVAALGVFVATVRSRVRASVAFAVFTTASGLAFVALTR